MKKKIVITGGAGFIGSNLISKLSKDEWEIKVLDSLLKQVHPNQDWKPPNHVKFIKANVCNKKSVREALLNANYIVHLAAETGVGQSAYELARYVKTNEFCTAVVLEEASKIHDTLKGVIIASSRAVYGEGMYDCKNCGPLIPKPRKLSDLKLGQWEPLCQKCQAEVAALSATEEQPLSPSSVYGITKINQEQLLRQFSSMFNIPGIALRFQNVYGPGQSLSNPYTGILAVFSARILSGNPIYIYEDGKESRDFVFIEDIVRSIILSLEKGFSTNYEVYNVGSGRPTKVIEVANKLVDNLGEKVPITVTGKYRVGDIRHAYADISKIQKEFGFKPEFSIEEGLALFADWVKKQPLPADHYYKTESELRKRGLLLEVGGRQDRCHV